MAVDVSAFSALARKEFMDGKFAADEKPYPATYEPFTTTMASTTKVETHTYMSNLPRLARFKGYSPAVRLMDKVYTVPNYEWRIGPVSVRKTDLDDDQVGGYLRSINALPGRAQKDIGHEIMSHLAAGTSNLCFDGTAYFANSHTFGSGDNLDTADFASNDGVTHKVIALITDNAAIKPVIFQDREAMSGLMTDADTPQAAKLREFEYWADTRFGLAYGFWWDAVHVTITDTPTVEEVQTTLIPQIINKFRTFTLPKGRDSDATLKIHEGWEPTAQNFFLLTNLGVAERVKSAIRSDRVVTTGGQRLNEYQNVATVVPTSALD
jgi:phage major head subunit gpT-like protein